MRLALDTGKLIIGLIPINLSEIIGVKTAI